MDRRRFDALGQRVADGPPLLAIVPGDAHLDQFVRGQRAVHFGRDDFVAALALLVVFFVALPGLAWSLFGRGRMEVLP